MISTSPLQRAIIASMLCVMLKVPEAYGASQEERIWSPKQVKETLDSWSQKYPALFRQASVQQEYNVPYAGNETDCPYDDDHGCSEYFFTIQDFIRHPEGSRSSAHLPEVFWSGTLHGNEIHGPSVVMEAAKMLLESAACEALPGPNPSDSEIRAAKACRVGLGLRGINGAKRQWLARLVATRRIVVLPSANSLGYSRGTHGEAGVDPSHDFPFELGSDSAECMRTTASRAINEIFRDHMFQIALSFYSGGGAIGFAWRNAKHAPPDRHTQLEIAKGLGYTASGGSLIYEPERNPSTLFENSGALIDYVTATGSNELQGHEGSFEDWAYGASWHTNTSTCSPQTHGGYLPEKTQYNNSTNRALALLVSINKESIEKSLESNVNLALASVDLVQPYVNVFGINNLALADDIVPMNEAMSSSCLKTRSVIASARRDSLEIEWTVGGALRIDYTDLFYAVNLNKEEEEALDCAMQPDDIDLSNFERATYESHSGGTGYFSEPGSDPKPDKTTTAKEEIMGPVFQSKINIKDLKAGDRVIVIASARVDQNWNLPRAPNATLPSPQSHLTNARTNPDWNHLHNGKRIKGRLNWFSIPLAIVLEDIDSRVTFEIENRFSPGPNQDTKPTQAPSSQSTDLGADEKMNNPEQEKPNIDEEVHDETETNEYDIATKVNNQVLLGVVWRLLVTLIIFSVFIMILHLAKRKKLMNQMQSVLHAERSAGERGNGAVSHRSGPHGPAVEEVVDFDDVGIYKNNRGNRPTVRREHSEDYGPGVVGDVRGGDSDSDDSDDDDFPEQYEDDFPSEYVPPQMQHARSSSTRYIPQQYSPPEDLEDVYMA